MATMVPAIQVEGNRSGEWVSGMIRQMKEYGMIRKNGGVGSVINSGSDKCEFLDDTS